MKKLVLAAVSAAALSSAALSWAADAAGATGAATPLVPGSTSSSPSSDGNKAVPGYLVQPNVGLCAHGSPQVGPNLLPQCPF
jgi:opacity protein-like surface antigen